VIFPTQSVTNGLVTLQVNENPVGHLTVSGSKYHSIDQIKEQLPSAMEGKVLDVKAFQDEVKQLNTDDRTVTPGLALGADRKSVDVTLAVEDHLPLSGSLEINNKKSPSTSEWRTVATLGYDNFWQREHSFSLSYQTAPQNPSDTQVLVASYLLHFDARRWTLAATGVFSNSDIASGGGISVLGKGQVGSLRLTRGLSLDDDTRLNFTAGADYKHFRSQTNLDSSDGNSSLVVNDVPLTYVPFSLGLGLVHVTGRSEGQAASTLQSDLTFSFTSAHLGSTSTDLGANRAYAHGRQSYLRDNISYSRDLPYAFQGYGRLAFQLTDQSLISNEQFSAGGADTVRGYYESEALGDYGTIGGIELRRPMSLADVSWIPASMSAMEFTPFAFLDGARLLLRDAQPEQTSHFLLSSAGMGLGFNYRRYATGYVDFAYPLRSGPFTQSGDSSVLLRVVGSF